MDVGTVRQLGCGVGAAARVAGAPHVGMGVHNSSVPSLRGGASGKRGANHRMQRRMKNVMWSPIVCGTSMQL